MRNFWVSYVTVDRTAEKIFRFPLGARHSAIRKFHTQSAIADVGAVFQTGFLVSVVHGKYRNRHGILRKNIDANHIVWSKWNRIYGDELFIDIHFEPIVGVDVDFDCVFHRRLDQIFWTAYC